MSLIRQFITVIIEKIAYLNTERLNYEKSMSVSIFIYRIVLLYTRRILFARIFYK